MYHLAVHSCGKRQSSRWALREVKLFSKQNIEHGWILLWNAIKATKICYLPEISIYLNMLGKIYHYGNIICITTWYKCLRLFCTLKKKKLLLTFIISRRCTELSIIFGERHTLTHAHRRVHQIQQGSEVYQICELICLIDIVYIFC